MGLKSKIYSILQSGIGANRLHRFMLSQYLKPEPGMQVLDFGCGPANILNHFPEVTYYGMDVNAGHIENARSLHRDKQATFECFNPDDYQLPPGPFDLVMVIGVLHHMTDEQVHYLFRQLDERLKSGGRLVTIDGCYEQGQSRIAKRLLDNDQGQYVRTEAAYRELFDPYDVRNKSHTGEYLSC